MNKEKKHRFTDVTHAVALLVRKGAHLSLKDKTISLTMKQRGLRTLAAADFVAKTYNMKIV
jgi:hypothetical protein